MCVENHTEVPRHPMKEIFHFKWRLIDDVVGFSTTPAAGDGTLGMEP